MTTAKTMAAEALFPILSVFHSVSGLPLQAIWQIHTNGSLDTLIFDCGLITLVVKADENDDSIDISTSTNLDYQGAGSVNISDQAPWSRFLGKPFGWGWITINQQGYCDGLLFSFGGLVPQIILNVVASSIKVSMVVTTG